MTVEPGQPAQLTFKPLSCQKPLQVIRCDEFHLEETLEAHQGQSELLKVIVELEEPKVDLIERV